MLNFGSWIRAAWNRVVPGRATAVSFDAPLSVPTPLYVIGDIHGRMDLWENLTGRIAADQADHADMAGALQVYLGDYIDRGPDSAAVLTHIFAQAQADPDHVYCLKGNHEDMMCAFLGDPVEKGARWLRHGGLQTLASFGVRGVTDRSAGLDLIPARDQLRSLLPDGLEDWLHQLPHLYQFGNLVCAHAGLDPELPPRLNDAKTCVWGHPQFLTRARQDGIWVAYGHYIVDYPRVEQGRIALDTGAFGTGRLTVGAMRGDMLRFLP